MFEKQTSALAAQIEKVGRGTPCPPFLPLCLCDSVANGGRPQGLFKIKTPSPNLRKIGKVMQGNASVFDTPPGGPPINLPKPSAKELKIPYFKAFYPCSGLLFDVVFYPQKHAIYARFLQ